MNFYIDSIKLDAISTHNYDSNSIQVKDLKKVLG